MMLSSFKDSKSVLQINLNECDQTKCVFFFEPKLACQS